ncbi:HTH domain-containing protein [Schaalia cardiffensis]
MIEEDELTWIDAIVKVLRDRGEPMDYSQIAQAIIDEGLRNVSTSLNPAASVNTTISLYSKNQRERCPVVRVSRGVYGLREWQKRDLTVGLSGGLRTTDYDLNFDVEPQENATSIENQSIIACYGMYWRRSLVSWNTNPQLLGSLQVGSQAVDFSNQIGVYLLHDGSRTVYVGQVVAPRLGTRLFEHTRDRLGGRWDRFSWFGVRPVCEDGTLGNIDSGRLMFEAVVDALEAVLIEATEPPLNRRSGNQMTGLEFLQVEDSQLVAARQRALAMKILDGVL